MSTRRIHIALLAATLFGVSSFAAGADTQPKSKESTHPMAMEHMVASATTRSDHEAVAKRLESQAAAYEKEAEEHQRLAAQYRKAARSPKANANAEALARHCENMTTRMKESAREAREMAQLHRDVGLALAK